RGHSIVPVESRGERIRRREAGRSGETELTGPVARAAASAYCAMTRVHYAVARSHDRLAAQAVGESETRSPVVHMGLDPRSAVAVERRLSAASKLQRAVEPDGDRIRNIGIEPGDPVANLDVGRHNVVTHADIQGQVARDLPVVADPPGVVAIPRAGGDHRILVDAGGAERSQQIAGV